MPCRRAEVSVPVPNWWGKMEPRYILVVPSPSVLANHSKVVLRGSGGDHTHIWRMVMSGFWVFVGTVFVVVARDDIAQLKKSDPGVLSLACGVLTSLPSRLCSRLEDVGFFAAICGTSFHPLLLYPAFCRSQEVDWSVIGFENPFLHFRWNSAEVLELPDELVHGPKHTADVCFRHHHCRLPTIQVSHRSDVSCLSYPNAAQIARRALGDDASVLA